MDEFLEQLGYWLQQAYVYLPAFLTFISAIGFPSLVQIAKILASAKLYLTKVAVIIKKTNEAVEQMNRVVDFVLEGLDQDAAFFDELAAATINKKQAEAYRKHAAQLRQRRATAFQKIETIKEDCEQTKKKIKVKVKITPEANADEKKAE